MPYSGPGDPSLPSNVRRLPENRRAQWVEVWNSVYGRCIEQRGADAADECESAAFRQANGVVMMLETRDLSRIEIFAAGTWNGHTFSGADLDKIVSAYNSVKESFNVPIKLGHNDAQKLLEEDGLPAAGWVENVQRVGSKLVADFKKVPAKLAELIEAGAYRKRSVELNRNFTVGDKTYPLMLTGLALLGSTLPAVDSLTDIVSLYSNAQIEHEEDAELIIFADENQEETLDNLMSSVDDIARRAERFFKGKPGAPTIRQLHRAFKEGLLRINKQTHSREEETDMALADDIRKALELEDDDDILEEIKKLKTAKHSHDDDNDDGTAELAKRVLSLERENATIKAEQAVEAAIASGRLLPRQKETALKMALRSMEEFQEFVETQPEGLVKFGELGNDKKGDNFSRFEPTQDEVTVAKQMGVWSPEYRITLMRQKASSAGIEIPADFGKAAAGA